MVKTKNQARNTIAFFGTLEQAFSDRTENRDDLELFVMEEELFKETMRQFSADTLSQFSLSQDKSNWYWIQMLNCLCLACKYKERLSLEFDALGLAYAALEALQSLDFKLQPNDLGKIIPPLLVLLGNDESGIEILQQFLAENTEVTEETKIGEMITMLENFELTGVKKVQQRLQVLKVMKERIEGGHCTIPELIEVVDAYPTRITNKVAQQMATLALKQIGALPLSEEGFTALSSSERINLFFCLIRPQMTAEMLEPVRTNFLDDILTNKNLRNMQVQKIMHYLKDRFDEVSFENHVKVMELLMVQEGGTRVVWDPNLVYFYLDMLTEKYYRREVDPQLKLKLETLIDKASNIIKGYPLSVNGTLKVLQNLYLRINAPLPAVDEYFKSVINKDISVRLRIQIISHQLSCLKDDSKRELLCAQLGRIIEEILSNEEDLFESLVDSELYRMKTVSLNNKVLTHRYLDSAVTAQDYEAFRAVTKKYVNGQIELFVKPPVTDKTLHLRLVQMIHLILQYPRDHWEVHKELLRDRMTSSLQRIPNFIKKKHLP